MFKKNQVVVFLDFDETITAFHTYNYHGLVSFQKKILYNKKIDLSTVKDNIRDFNKLRNFIIDYSKQGVKFVIVSFHKVQRIVEKYMEMLLGKSWKDYCMVVTEDERYGFSKKPQQRNQFYSNVISKKTLPGKMEHIKYALKEINPEWNPSVFNAQTFAKAGHIILVDDDKQNIDAAKIYGLKTMHVQPNQPYIEQLKKLVNSCMSQKNGFIISRQSVNEVLINGIELNINSDIDDVRNGEVEKFGNMFHPGNVKKMRELDKNYVLKVKIHEKKVYVFGFVYKKFYIDETIPGIIDSIVKARTEPPYEKIHCVGVANFEKQGGVLIEKRKAYDAIISTSSKVMSQLNEKFKLNKILIEKIGLSFQHIKKVFKKGGEDIYTIHFLGIMPERVNKKVVFGKMQELAKKFFEGEIKRLKSSSFIEEYTYNILESLFMVGNIRFNFDSLGVCTVNKTTKQGRNKRKSLPLNQAFIDPRKLRLNKGLFGSSSLIIEEPVENGSTPKKRSSFREPIVISDIPKFPGGKIVPSKKPIPPALIKAKKLLNSVIGDFKRRQERFLGGIFVTAEIENKHLCLIGTVHESVKPIVIDTIKKNYESLYGKSINVLDKVNC